MFSVRQRSSLAVPALWKAISSVCMQIFPAGLWAISMQRNYCSCTTNARWKETSKQVSFRWSQPPSLMEDARCRTRLVAEKEPPNMNQNPQKKHYTSDLLRYAGLGAQIFVALGISVFAGYKADRWLNSPFPVLVWVLPLLVLSLMLYKLIRETTKQDKK